LVAGELGHDGDRLGRREGEVVEVALSAADGTVGGDAVGAVAGAKELTGAGIETLSEGLEVFVADLSRA
jgi:hypothetical protein